MNNCNQSANLMREPGDFVRLLVEHQFQLYAFILTLVPNSADADDVMQETSVALWEMFEQFQPGSNFGAWACTVARYRILKFRDRKPEALLQVGDDVLDLIAAVSLSQSDESEVRRHALDECIRRLPPRDYALLKQSFDPATRTLKQVSEVIGRPVNTVYKAMSRIHQALFECVRRTLKEQG